MIERQGMFWRVRCQCGIQAEEPLKIYLLCDTQRIDLGLCVCEQDGCGLVSRIPVKTGQPEEFIFHIESARSEQYIPVAEDKPFSALQLLDSAKFLVRNGQPGILIDDQMLISKPTGQWSEPSTSL